MIDLNAEAGNDLLVVVVVVGVGVVTIRVPTQNLETVVGIDLLFFNRLV